MVNLENLSSVIITQFVKEGNSDVFSFRRHRLPDIICKGLDMNFVILLLNIEDFSDIFLRNHSFCGSGVQYQFLENSRETTPINVALVVTDVRQLVFQFQDSYCSLGSN